MLQHVCSSACFCHASMRRTCLAAALDADETVSFGVQCPTVHVLSCLPCSRCFQLMLCCLQALCIGVSSHQKMDHLTTLVTVLGYESVCVFCDCIDEAGPQLSAAWHLRGGSNARPLQQGAAYPRCTAQSQLPDKCCTLYRVLRALLHAMLRLPMLWCD